KKNSIAEFELERQDFKIKLKRGSNGGPAPVQYEEAPLAAPLSPVASVPPGTAPASLPPASGGTAAPLSPVASVPPGTAPASLPPASGGKGELEIKSPMIGTFYLAPSPESAPYVEIGSEVNLETVVCIIEAM